MPKITTSWHEIEKNKKYLIKVYFDGVHQPERDCYEKKWGKAVDKACELTWTVKCELDNTDPSDINMEIWQ